MDVGPTRANGKKGDPLCGVNPAISHIVRVDPNAVEMDACRGDFFRAAVALTNWT
jgi:hypothetical protein